MKSENSVILFSYDTKACGEKESEDAHKNVQKNFLKQAN
ncbi:hypothetical protein C2W64_00693 [Brevibacillus laterosporus]|nr:hypothetical protein C2W64_00693 [Brevibacillus laterosporus]